MAEGDLLLKKAAEFTTIEDAALNAWLNAELAGFDDLAREILHAGLLAEHYRSLLSEDDGKITSEQSAVLRRLQAEFAATLDRLTEHVARQTGLNH